jgi:hypothetical protein
VRNRGGPRRGVLVSGLGVTLAYLGLATLSGHLSLLARRPLLDGYQGAPLYRWVSPPPELAATNVPPAAGEFTVPLTERGSRPDVLTTDDAQATVILTEGTFPPADEQDEVKLTIDPLDPANLSPPDPPLRIVGNVYRIEARYEPSGERVRAIESPLEVILIYPLTSDASVGQHRVIASKDGMRWILPVEGTDSPGIQQTEAPVGSLGYVAAGGDLRPATSAPIPPTTGENTTLGIALIVGAVCAGLMGIGLLLRGRNPHETGRR